MTKTEQQTKPQTRTTTKIKRKAATETIPVTRVSMEGGQI